MKEFATTKKEVRDVIVTEGFNPTFNVPGNEAFNVEADPFINQLTDAIATLASSLVISQETSIKNSLTPANVGIALGEKPKDASVSQGFISFQGTVSTLIPQNSLVSINGLLYNTLAGAVVNNTSIPISNIATDGLGTITVTTASNDNFASKLLFSISGVSTPAYNISNALITVTGEKTFTYQKLVTPAGNISGSGLITGTLLSVEVKSQEFGLKVNVDRDVEVKLNTPIVGINSSGYVQYTKISGGAEAETKSEFNARMLVKFTTPDTGSNYQTVINAALSVPGVTRAWIQEYVNSVEVGGEVRVRFVLDGKPITIFPDAAEKTAVRNAVLPFISAGIPLSLVVADGPQNKPYTIAFAGIPVGINDAVLGGIIRADLKTLFNTTQYNSDLALWEIQGVISDAFKKDGRASSAQIQAVLTSTVITIPPTPTDDFLATIGTITGIV